MVLKILLYFSYLYYYNNIVIVTLLRGEYTGHSVNSAIESKWCGTFKDLTVITTYIL